MSDGRPTKRHCGAGVSVRGLLCGERGGELLCEVLSFLPIPDAQRLARVNRLMSSAVEFTWRLRSLTEVVEFHAGLGRDHPDNVEPLGAMYWSFVATLSNLPPSTVLCLFRSVPTLGDMQYALLHSLCATPDATLPPSMTTSDIRGMIDSMIAESNKGHAVLHAWVYYMLNKRADMQSLWLEYTQTQDFGNITFTKRH